MIVYNIEELQLETWHPKVDSLDSNYGLTDIFQVFNYSLK